MPSPLLTHLWQSTLFAAAAGMMTLALKKNPARTRYWVWFIGLAKFLVPFGVLMSLGGHVSVPRWTPKAPAIMPPAISFVIDEIARPTFTAAPVAPQTTNDLLPTILLGIWACGFVAIGFCWARRWMRVRADVRAASRLPINIGIPVVSSPALREPGVFGIFRPTLMLPDGMAVHLSKAESDAILAHELCHVRCHDNLTAVIYMLVESLFWFHPLVWWMGTRLVAERERACDEEVLRLGSEAKVYAEGILKVCELYLESPLECVAGVTGSNLRHRIHVIMTHRGTERMSMVKKLLLATACVAAIALPVFVGISVGVSHAQLAPTPKWEVASVKPSGVCEDGGGGRGAGKSAGGRASTVSEGSLTLNCYPVVELIQMAYGTYANGQRKFGRPVPIEKAPAWAQSERYSINAKAEEATSQGIMKGPMLQALLEDRFKLRIHRDTREVSVYALTVAKGGPKKLPAAQPGGCITVDPDHPTPSPAPPRAFGEPGPPRCGGFYPSSTVSEGTDVLGTTMASLCAQLSVVLDREVIDKTGITGMFDLHLQMTSRPSPPADASISEKSNMIVAGLDEAFEKLGLKIEETKGPAEFIVIDHLEMPSEN